MLDNYSVRMVILVYGIPKVFTNSKWLNLSFSQKLKDTYIQKWYSSTNVTPSNNNYKLFKAKFETSNYIKQLPKLLCRRFMAFRTRNHRFPVEVGRWFGTPFNECKCHLCNSDLGDEYHYLLVCKNFDNERKQYLNPYYYTRPNVLKYFEIMNTNKDSLLKKIMSLY